MNIQEFEQVVRESFNKPEIVPTRRLYCWFERSGKVECCGLGAIYYDRASPTNNHDMCKPVMQFLIDSLGIQVHLLAQFINGFDGLTPSAYLNTQEKEFYELGLRLGKEFCGEKG